MSAARRSIRQTVSGLTLIEMLVALTILAILLSTVYGTFVSAIQATRRARDDDGIYQVARTVMERITGDLEMAFYRPGSDRPNHATQLFLGHDRAEGDYARDRLDLTTAGHIFLRDGRPETDIVEVSYYIDDSLWDRPLLVRREDPLPDEDLRHGGTLRVLAEQVVSLNFRYREPGPAPWDRQRPTNADAGAKDETQEDTEPQWYDAWNADTFSKPNGSLPELVEVTLVLRQKVDGEYVEYTFSTTVQLYPFQIWQRSQMRR